MFVDKFFRSGRHNLDDTRFKSLLKTISWRLLASLDTLMSVLLSAGNLKTARSTMLLEIFTKMSLYCLHEQVWTRFHKCETGISWWRVSKLIIPVFDKGQNLVAVLDINSDQPAFSADNFLRNLKRFWLSHLAQMRRHNGIAKIR